MRNPTETSRTQTSPTVEGRTAVAVFCGSQHGSNPAFAAAAIALGRHLGEAGMDLVYGGGSVGLMGTVANATLAAGGRVIGVIPKSLADKEIAHDGLTELVVTDDMHSRKSTMADLADAFVALPGGIGTYEELIEQWTWGKLAIHSKPIMVLDVADYFSPFLQMVKGMTDAGFLAQRHADMLSVITRPTQIAAVLAAYQPPPAQWPAPAP